ncbi:hypothetical protein GQ457_04G026310 [Hibiscus cannabinus]
MVKTKAGIVFESECSTKMRFEKEITLWEMTAKMSQKIRTEICGLCYRWLTCENPVRYCAINLQDDDDVQMMIVEHEYMGIRYIELFAEVCDALDPSRKCRWGETLNDSSEDKDIVDPDLFPDDVCDAPDFGVAEFVQPSGDITFYEPPYHMGAVDFDAMRAPRFPNMHRLTSSEHGELSVGLEFDEKNEATLAVKEYIIKKHVDYTVVESNKRVFFAKCVKYGNECNWKIRVSKLQMTNRWRVTKYSGNQTCLKTSIDQDHRKLDSTVISHHVMKLVEANPRVPVSTIQATIAQQFGYQIKYKKGWRARDKAMNPCMVDGTWLYGRYSHVLLIAVAQNGEDNVFPIVFAIIEQESTDAWNFFLTNLREHVVKEDGVYIIFDRGCLDYIFSHCSFKIPSSSLILIYACNLKVHHGIRASYTLLCSILSQAPMYTLGLKIPFLLRVNIGCLVIATGSLLIGSMVSELFDSCDESPSVQFTAYDNGCNSCGCCTTKAPSQHADSQSHVMGTPQVHVATSSHEQWVVDSGATHHVTPDSTNVMQGAGYNGPGKLLVGNGVPLDVKMVGSLSINSSSRALLLTDLLHVPTITKNLLSVSKFARDNAVFFEFHAKNCLVCDEATGVVLLQGREDGGLYKFATQLINTTASCANVETNLVPSSISTYDIWHRRLGHPIHDTLVKVCQTIDVNVSKEVNKTSIISPPGGSNRSSTIPILKPTQLSTTPRQDPIRVQPQELGSDPSSRTVVDSNAIGSTGQQRQNMVILPDMALDESSGDMAPIEEMRQHGEC